MRIGELAQAVGVDVQTVRFYERQGLLPMPARRLNGYRAYGPEHVERLAFIRHCRALDLTLEEAGQLLQLLEHPADECGDALALVVRHRQQVRKRIASLQALEQRLEDLQARCAGNADAAHCAILAELAGAAQAEAPACDTEPHPRAITPLA